MATKISKNPSPLIVRGRNAAGKLIEGTIPAGELAQEDPGLVIQRLLAKRKNLSPTPIDGQ